MGKIFEDTEHVFSLYSFYQNMIVFGVSMAPMLNSDFRRTVNNSVVSISDISGKRIIGARKLSSMKILVIS